MSVHEHVLNKNVGVAGMVEVSSNVSYGLGVHDVEILRLPVKFPGGDELVAL